ncbi:hypothetical protein [Streptomyces sp. NBC_01477]|uniref:hypothetical protein n=1 Tax=Streptomyces sp. NBC_01477 TaxID=2976015 RepID=UPI002E32DAA2|nr:hypothetical protein [Streptomyces sp. NBC_01477]
MTRTNATRLIGPYGASALGNANTPVPMTDPMTSAVAVGSPNRRCFAAVSDVEVCSGASLLTCVLN